MATAVLVRRTWLTKDGQRAMLAQLWHLQVTPHMHPQTIPPMSGAANYHSVRVYRQVQEWKGSAETAAPCDARARSTTLSVLRLVETAGDRAARTHYKCHVTMTETMMLRKCKSFDCSNAFLWFTRTVSALFSYFMMTLIMICWNVACFKDRWICMSVVFVHFLWFCDLRIIFHHQPTFSSCIFEVHYNFNDS